MSKTKTSQEQQENHSIPVISEESTSLGDIKINLSVINNIVRLAALEVPGVVSVSGSFKDGLAEMFSKDAERGVKVAENEAGEYVVEIHVILKFGVKLDATASRIQQSIYNQVDNMTSKSCASITVFIDGVKMEKPEANELNEDDNV